MRVLIVSKTRMGEERICVGGHDLDDFRSLRLFKHDGTYMTQRDNVNVGDIWDVHYESKPGASAPHVEDVNVRRDGATCVGRERDIDALVRRRDVVWGAIEELFEGTLRLTPAGSAYVPVEGQLPTRSTGYWSLDSPLRLHSRDGKHRYIRDGGGLRGVRYVGLDETVPVLAAGTLIRLSLSRRFTPADAAGYWLQLSGWY